MADRRLAPVLLAVGLAWPAHGAAAPPPPPKEPVGLWLTEDRGGVISVQHCGGDALCGVIVGLTGWSAAGDPRRDWRGRSQCQYVLLGNLRSEDDGRWHGTVTDPEDGRTYGAEIWVHPDGALRLRGYIGLPLLGSTQKWPPFHGQTRPDCHFTPSP